MSEDFTHKEYKKLLRLAKEKYSFCFFTNYQEKQDFLLWRHDVDCSLHDALKLAKIEREEGVRATYFIHLHNKFYNPLEIKASKIVLEIREMGHQVGLHFDFRFYKIENEADLINCLQKESKVFEDLFEIDVLAFSYHDPDKFCLSFDKTEYAGLINAYSYYFQNEVAYCSDSNGVWRYDSLRSVLESNKAPKLQVLTHPLWWQENSMTPKEKIDQVIALRAARTRLECDEELAKSGRGMVY